MIPRWLTAHRAVLLALAALAVVSLVVSAVDGDFAYRPAQLVLSLLIAVVVCGAVSMGCAALVRVPPGSDSWLITALILFFILPGVTDSASALTVVIGAAAAGLSKYVLVWRRRLVINPAVAGAVVVYALAYAGVGSIGYPSWWVAAKPLLIPMIVIAVVLVSALREWQLVVVFLAAALITIGVVQAVRGGQSVSMWLTSSPMLFVAAVMLPEPLTSPTTRVHRLIYAAGVGVLMYWQVTIPVTSGFTLEFVPEIALLIGSLYAFVIRLLTRNPATTRVRLHPAERASVLAERASDSAERASDSAERASDLAERASDPAEWVRPIAANTYELTAADHRPLVFTPGQWAVLSAPAWSRLVWRSSRRVFSYAEAPGEQPVRFAFTVAAEPSPVKRGLLDGTTGHLYLDSSGGDFTLPRTTTDGPIVLLAAGIGITPFRSMLRAAIAQEKSLAHITVVHVLRSADRVVYTADLDAARSAGARVEVVESVEFADGLTVDGLDDLVGNAVLGDGSAHYFISGTTGFVTRTSRAVRHADPATRRAVWRVHTDAFRGY